jgi:hypothetical protein
MRADQNEYRCTRNAAYEPGTPGHKDPHQRQGRYIQACNETEAVHEMGKRFPNEVGNFHVELWKRGQLMRAHDALRVITLTPHIREYLESKDPKALEQAEKALR